VDAKHLKLDARRMSSATHATKNTNVERSGPAGISTRKISEDSLL